MLGELLEWDTKFFGRRVGRARLSRLEPDSVAALLAWCGENKIECLYFLADSDDPGTVRLAAANQFDLVDIRVTLRAALCKAPRLPEPPAGLTIGEATEADMPAMRALAAVSHRATRFYIDGRFSAAKADALYQTWIEQSFQATGKGVLLARWRGAVAGYVVCDGNGGEIGQISLIAVAPGFQGQGVGQALVGAGLQWFGARPMQAAVVVTQARNVGALQLYEKSGFTTQQVQLWYHRWFEADPSLAA